MCQMRIVLKERDRVEVILDGAAVLKVTDGGILVNALFEPPKLVEGASLAEIDFLKGTVTLTKGRSDRHGTDNDNRKTASAAAALDRAQPRS